MALPNPKGRRPAPTRAGRTAQGNETPPEQHRAPVPPSAPPPTSVSPRARRKQAEDAARARREQAGHGTHKDVAHAKRLDRPEATTSKTQQSEARSAARDARKAQRAEQNARRAARLRRVIKWVFPDHTRRVSRGRAIAILLFNVFPLPGLGTVLYGHWERGLMQFLLTFLFLVGWVWAVFDGFRIVSAAYRPPPALRQPTRRPTR